MCEVLGSFSNTIWPTSEMPEYKEKEIAHGVTGKS